MGGTTEPNRKSGRQDSHARRHAHRVPDGTKGPPTRPHGRRPPAGLLENSKRATHHIRRHTGLYTCLSYPQSFNTATRAHLAPNIHPTNLRSPCVWRGSGVGLDQPKQLRAHFVYVCRCQREQRWWRPRRYTQQPTPRHLARFGTKHLRDAEQVEAAVVSVGLLRCVHRTEGRAGPRAVPVTQQPPEAVTHRLSGLGVGAATRVVVLKVRA